jgi:hypothetical protein
VKVNSNTKETAAENQPSDELFFRLSEFLDTGFEFLVIAGAGAQLSLKRDEIICSFERGRVFLKCATDAGPKAWQAAAAEQAERKLTVSVLGRAGGEKESLELIPRITAADMMAAIKEARLRKAIEIAEVVAENFPQSKLVKVRLSQGIRAGEYGTNAQILLQTGPGQQAAIFAPVVSKVANGEGFLASAISWFINVSERAKKARIEQLWLMADKRTLNKLKKLVALFRPRWREQIFLFAIGIENRTVTPIKVPELSRLWREKPRRVKLPGEQYPTETAANMIALAPEAIDIAYSAHGETLRYHGLPFARVRTLLGQEKAWFGTERKRRVPLENSLEEFGAFFTELAQNRNAAAENRSHYYYRAAPEQWLESILRRDITRLDANLILSPLYHQFRASAGQIDLLAARRDGRLVVIELKVAPSREVVFQAADYWRQIELQRRSGNLAKARAFGEMEILDEPALVYLVAPALSFHHDLEFWASVVSPKIEVYQYVLHENWRKSIKVIERRKL